MTVIIVPNGIWKKLGEIWKLLERGELKPHSDEIKQVALPQKLDEYKLIALVKERLHHQTVDGANLIVGSQDFLPFDFLNKGDIAGQAVCCLLKRFNDAELEEIIKLAQEDARIRGLALKWFVDPGSSIDPTLERDRAEFKQKAKEKRVPLATGFLVGRQYLLTNLHVVEAQNQLSKISAVFRYEGNLQKLKDYSFDFDPDFWKPTQNPDLDYILLKLKPRDGQEAGDTFRPISLAKVNSVQVIPQLIVQNVESLFQDKKLLEDEWEKLKENGFPGDLVNIIQHPEGRSKEIVIFNNKLQELYQDFLVYTSDAQPGSSGSPLFNAQWELIGLHQAALLEQKESEISGEGRLTVKGYLGIRMSSILADLQKQATTDPEIQAFLDEVLHDRSQETTTKQVFILAGRDRSSVLPKKLASLEQRSMLQLQQQVVRALNSLDPSIEVRSIDGSGKNLKSAIQEINQQAAKSSDTQSVAIELLTDNYSEPKVGGISTYYYGGNPRRKDEALSLLERIQDKGIPVFGIGAYSDRVTSSGRLDFCRQTTMPALAFYAGYLSNPDDLARIEALQTKISPLAEGIAAGLLAWLERIN